MLLSASGRALLDVFSNSKQEGDAHLYHSKGEDFGKFSGFVGLEVTI